MAAKETETDKNSVLGDKEKFGKNEQASEKLKHMGDKTEAGKKEGSRSEESGQANKKQ
jgi:hypothetical protein